MRERTKGLLMGYGLGMLTLVACASSSYKYYGVSIPDECYDKGTLLGKSGSDGWADIPLSECKPDAAGKGKCWIEIDSDFWKKERDLLQCQQELKDCQKGSPPHLINNK